MTCTNQWLAVAVIGSVLLVGCSSGGSGSNGSSGGHEGVCGDGKLDEHELCDDDNTSDGDGCDATCNVEPGYSCHGSPSTCTLGCGDGTVSGSEVCDDGAANGTYGHCKADCSGSGPSCGDGAVNGSETCDDGAANGTYGHCKADCSGPGPSCGDGAVNGSETCDDGAANGTYGHCLADCSGPGPSCGDRATNGPEACDDGAANGTYGYCKADCSGLGPSCGDGMINGPEACDDGDTNPGDGCDATCHIEKGYSCTGTISVCTSGCGDGTMGGSEGCDDGNTKDGDGCSSTCQIEPGFTCSGTNSLCCIPEVEANDASTSASGPIPDNVFVCGSIFPRGDVDYFSFTLPAPGSFFISTYNGMRNNLDCDGSVDTKISLYGPDGQTLIDSNDDNGLPDAATDGGSGCSTIDPTANPSVNNLPAGTYYVKVERTGASGIINAYNLRVHAVICGDGVVEWSEQCDGGPSCNASCVATTPGPGESLPTAEPFPGCPATPSSTVRLGVPSCFPTLGPVQWYSHVATDRALAVLSDAPGPISLFDDMGNELRCSTDATQIPVSTFSTAGKTFYVAVSLPSSMTCLDFIDRPYTGVQGLLTDLNVTFPSGSSGFGATTPRYGIAVSPTQIFVGAQSKVFEAPKAGNASAVLRNTTGISVLNLGQDLNFANGWLFSLSALEGAARTTTARVYRIYNGSTWGGPTVPSTAWETSPTYSTNASMMIGFAYDGANLISTMYGDNPPPIQNPILFYSYTVASPSKATLIGTVSPWDLIQSNGVAADSKYLYVAGNGMLGQGIGPRKEGIYRFDRANLSAPPIQIASYHVTGSKRHVGLTLDDIATPGFLYGRDANGDIHVIVDPAGAAEDLGVISTLGTSLDRGLVYDPLTQAIYFEESETDPNGRLVKLQ